MDFKQEYQIIMDDDKQQLYSKLTKRYLISTTRIFRAIEDIELATVPSSILNEAQEYGKVFMEEINDPEHPIQKLLLEKNWTIEQSEMLISNGIWVGYVDVVCKDKDGGLHVLEIKTRNDSKERERDWAQLSIYAALLKPTWKDAKFELAIWNRKKEAWTTNVLSAGQFHKSLEKINGFTGIISKKFNLEWEQ